MTDLSGMTGFARVTGEGPYGTWAWEAKSVNGRGLDIRLNTPPGFDGVEKTLKSAAARLFKRGSLQVSLRIEMGDGVESASVNSAVLDVLVREWCQRMGQDAPPGDVLATLMTQSAIIERSSGSIRTLADDDAVVQALTIAGQEALEGLNTARCEEGVALKMLLLSIVEDMAAITAEADALAKDHPQLLRDRLIRSLADIGAGDQVDTDRLAAETAIAAAKADVREELDRLRTHFDSARALLDGGSPVGRKLDFLAQELNREANTLCSKAISSDLTNAGLSLKALIDQFKEQAANVE